MTAERSTLKGLSSKLKYEESVITSSKAVRKAKSAKLFIGLILGIFFVFSAIICNSPFIENENSVAEGNGVLIKNKLSLI